MLERFTHAWCVSPKGGGSRPAGWVWEVTYRLLCPAAAPDGAGAAAGGTQRAGDVSPAIKRWNCWCSSAMETPQALRYVWVKPSVSPKPLFVLCNHISRGAEWQFYTWWWKRAGTYMTLNLLEKGHLLFLLLIRGCRNVTCLWNKLL